MPSSDLPFVDAAHIRKLVGVGAFERARPYARGGAVLDLNWIADAGRLTAVVQGTANLPYRCQVTLEPTGRDGYRPVDSACDCPMREDCKHVAAALLTANARRVTAEHDATAAAAARAPASDAPGPRNPAPTPGWKSTLSAVTPGRAHGPGGASALRGTGSGTGADSGNGSAPLGVQFELREKSRRDRGRWQRTSAVTVAATANTPADRLRVTLRPVTLSASGRWVAGGLSWSSMQFQLNRMSLDERQVRWFGQLAALARTQASVYTGSDADRLVLDDYPSPLLWRLFGEAQRLGIQLVGGGKGAGLTVATQAAIGLDAASAEDGTLTLSPTVRFDETAVDAETVRSIADHGLYAVAWEHASGAVPQLQLGPTDAPLTAEHRRLLAAGPIEVPAAEVPEFYADFFPALSRLVPISTTDAQLQLPELVPPLLVVTTTFLAEHVVKLGWEWEYRSGDRTVRHPLETPGESRGRMTRAAAAGRDAPFEQHTLAAVVAALAGFTTPARAGNTLRDIEAAEFTEHALPVLESLPGVRVDIVGERPDYRELHDAPTLRVTTMETEQRDWFDLGVLVEIEGRQVPFAPLFSALSKGLPKLLLIDKTYLSLKQPVFDRLRELIMEAQSLDEWETGPRINRYQAALWAEFEDLADESEQAVTWRESVGGLLKYLQTDATPGENPGAAPGALPGLTEELPSGLNATLRPYQHDGYAWLTFLWRHALGGVLADDMGLGKTVQTLALVAHARTAAPFLVVAPTSVVANWVSEAERFTPGLTVASITQTQAKSGTPLAETIAGADIVVTSYTLFRLDFDEYQKQQWAGLILDEAQFVKNHASRAHRCARDLDAPFKLAVTGTPMENNLTELWSMFDIVAPGLFPSLRRFTEDYVRPIAAAASPTQATPAAHGAELLARLRRRIRPLMLRRTKELVAPELPAKQEQVLQIELAPRHRRIYDTVLQRERQKLLQLLDDDLDSSRFIVFRSLTLLRMLSLDASLIDEAYASVPSSKLDALLEQLEDVLAEGHRALIFSQFTTYLRKVATRLEERGVDYAYLDGSTTTRQKVIDGFKQGSAPVFLVSLKAGGFGLNLTEADYVFLLDPWWNPASEAQAIDRTHRIGQTKNVMVYRLVATGTIEEKVMALKAQKAQLFDAVLDADAAFGSALTADDIRGLLE
ncbi:DEAD/DEAH box helicase [Leifsonia sp. Root112D2]|uniref:DEAD/DEAH box helicase n=1 Tax=Leifsonia sp. Root112D2 TaxID=1736426 RepID=UPI0006F8C7FE|nr:SNF2-related protein [Leifsonia sp. Root112D2]KQV06546.1 hypothetical protein ASC63_03715 [Leifsonia sp. Root112D2]